MIKISVNKNNKKMKKHRIKIKNNEVNGMKIIEKKLKINSEISQPTNKNYTQNISFKEPNFSNTTSFYKESNLSQHIPKEKEEIFLTKSEIKQKPHISHISVKNMKQNPREIYSNTLNNMNENNINKNEILLFQRSNTINDIGLKQKDSSIESDNNRIYVHKILKDFNNYNDGSNINARTYRKENDKDVNNEKTFCKSHRNKDNYSKLVVFSNKSKYFRKKQLSEIENISNGICGKIKDMKYFESPIKKHKNSFLNLKNKEDINKNIYISNDEEEEEEEESLSQNDIDNDNTNQNDNDKEINNKRDIDYDNDNDNENGNDYRMDNLKDYINIYSINNNSSNKKNENDYNVYEDNNTSDDEDKIINNKKNSNNKINKNIYIYANNINNIKNEEKNGNKNNTININKNIIINKKIILLPEEKNQSKDNWSKTSYGFFNQYENIINAPYQNYSNNTYVNKNVSNKNSNNNLIHCKTKSTLNSFVYQKKNFGSPTPKASSNYISFNTENCNDLKKNHNFLNNIDINKMLNNEYNFYEPKKITYNNNNNNKGRFSTQIYNRHLTVKKPLPKLSDNFEQRNTIGKMPNYGFYKLNTPNQAQYKKSFLANKNGPKLNEYKESEVSKIINRNNTFNSDNKNNTLSLIEKVKFLEMELKLILNKINEYQNCEKECYDFIHFYFDHNFYIDKKQIFKNTKNKELITNYTKMEIILLFICYDILCSKKFSKACIILKSIFYLLYDNFIFLLILVTKNNKNKGKEFIKSLNVIINEYVEEIKKEDLININEHKVIEVIGNNTNEATNYYKMLIDSLYKKHYNEKDYSVKFPDCIRNIDMEKMDISKTKNVIASFFYETYKKIINYDFVEFKYFFYLFLSHKNDKMSISHKSSRVKKTKLNKNKEKKISKNSILPPIKNNFKYTLILDLDETLIYLQNQDRKTITLRPNIFEFLHEMKCIYEIIIFSENSQEYVEPIVDFIQQKEKLFDYILCKQYMTFDSKGQEIKNLNLLGRDLKNIVVVDNMQQYYKNTDNLICIKSFFGDVNNDKKTLKFLGSILKEIKLDSEKTGDIRVSINNYKYKLYPKVINILD